MNSVQNAAFESEIALAKSLIAEGKLDACFLTSNGRTSLAKRS